MGPSASNQGSWVTRASDGDAGDVEIIDEEEETPAAAVAVVEEGLNVPAAAISIAVGLLIKFVVPCPAPLDPQVRVGTPGGCHTGYDTYYIHACRCRQLNVFKNVF
jgi:hypothetical protein